ncbi:MAG: NAD-dependent epimerase/dehydratase family protein [Paracoccaceae bacterium]
MKKVLITGAEGFIGTWLLCVLSSRPYQIFSVDNRSSRGERLFDKVDGASLVERCYRFDLSDYDALESILLENDFDWIIHLGAQAIVPRAFERPYETFFSNAISTLNILEICRSRSLKADIFCVTSDKVYENDGSNYSFKETDQLGGADIYSVSKSTSEFIARAYAKNHNKDGLGNIQTLRLGNVVGGGDWSVNRLIPDLFRSYREGTEFKVRYPDATRPFQHVLDVVYLIEVLYDMGVKKQIESFGVWNLGPRGNSFEYVQNVINLFEEMFGSLKIIKEPNPVKEDIFLSVNVDKISLKVREPKLNSEQSIIWALEWYKRYHNGESAVDLMSEQIRLWKEK